MDKKEENNTTRGYRTESLDSGKNISHLPERHWKVLTEVFKVNLSQNTVNIP